eukprot:1188227-Prorocentrum_minimum.AAC.2
MGGGAKLQMLLMWGVRDPPKRGKGGLEDVRQSSLDQSTRLAYLHSELTDACVATLGVSFAEVWLSWCKFLDVARMHQKEKLQQVTNRTKRTGIFSRRTNQMQETQEARVFSHDGPIRCRKHRYVLTIDQTDTGNAGILSRASPIRRRKRGYILTTDQSDAGNT